MSLTAFFFVPGGLAVPKKVKVETSGQAKAVQQGKACLSLWRGNERQMRLVHVRIKSPQGLGLIYGNGHDVFQSHEEVII